MNPTRCYAGIGSRATPLVIQERMSEIAGIAADHGWILRSGAAKGADSAFEEGCDFCHGKKQIFVPWYGFNNRYHDVLTPTKESFDIIRTVHPKYSQLSTTAQQLHARNVHQILGPNLDTPVDLVICWTPDGCTHHTAYSKSTGGTGTAIAIASKMGIPVHNMYDQRCIIPLIKKLVTLTV